MTLKVEEIEFGLPVLGFSSDETVMLDLDDVSFRVAKEIAFDVMKWFKLKGFIVLKSSHRHYHVVFDRRVSWRKNVKIMAWVCLLTEHNALNKWFIMKCIKGFSTLRVSPKLDKKTPRIVFRHGSQNRQIKVYLEYRKLAKKCYNARV